MKVVSLRVVIKQYNWNVFQNILLSFHHIFAWKYTDAVIKSYFDRFQFEVKAFLF